MQAHLIELLRMHIRLEEIAAELANADSDVALDVSLGSDHLHMAADNLGHIIDIMCVDYSDVVPGGDVDERAWHDNQFEPFEF
jgi:hypothetical protein